MSYVDGYVLPVPEDKRDAYLAIARAAAPIFKEHGALAVVEAWEDDVPDGKHTDFRRAVAAEPGERIVFSWVIWPSKEAREAGNKAVMADPRMNMADMPVDGKRMIWGGFIPVVEA